MALWGLKEETTNGSVEEKVDQLLTLLGTISKRLDSIETTLREAESRQFVVKIVPPEKT